MQHGGNIYQFAKQLHCSPKDVLDFSANINPHQAIDARCLQHVNISPYGDPDYLSLKQTLKQRYPIPDGVDIEVFNGASTAIFALLRWLQPKELVLCAPLYIEYAQIAKQLGCCNVQSLNRFSDNLTDIPRGSTVVLVNPSTPDGQLYALPALLTQWQAADCTIIIDESFLDFCEADSVSTHIAGYDKLFVIKSLSKFYGCAGIRIGFIMAATQAISRLKQLEPAWKLSSLDMSYMQQALANTAFIAKTRQQTTQWRALLQQVLQESGLFRRIYLGQANFLLAQLKDGMDGEQLQALLAPSRLLIRVCDNFIGLDKSHVRFAVKDPIAIRHLSDGLKRLKGIES